VAAALVAALVASTPAPAAAADPVLPAGATLTPPQHSTGSATALPSSTTEQSQGRRGDGPPAAPDGSTFPLPVDLSQPATADAKAAASGGGRAADTTAVDSAAAGAGQVSGLQRGAVEDTAARKWNSMEFVNPDGSRQQRIFGDLQFVAAPDGSMVPVDATLKAQPATGWLAPAASVAGVSFAPVSDGSTLARMDAGDGVSVGFGVAGSATVPVVVSGAGSVARYANVLPGADVELSATRYGYKDKVILHSTAAPTSWVFPLRTEGVTPSWDPQTGQVQLTDRHGNVVGTIPPAFMQDSSVDARSGGPAVSTHVSQTLVSQGDGWALQVELDPAWLADPARVWPVILDPAVWAGSTLDTFISSRDYAQLDNEGNSELMIGTYDGGGEVSESFLNFDLSSVAYDTIYSGALSLYNEWSWSCTPADVGVYAITGAWYPTNWWPGPGYDPNPLSAVQSVAHGQSGCAGARIDFPIDGARLTAWREGLEPFYGLTVRASQTDSHGWKRFWSANYTRDPNLVPYLFLNYAPQGPSYLNSVLPTPGGSVDTLTPTLFANYFNTDTSFSRSFDYRVCNGTPDAPVGCHESGWRASSSFQVPAGWLTTWDQPWYWQLAVSNGYSNSTWLRPFTSTAVVPQPGVTGHLAGAPEGSEMPGVNPQPGNYASTVTDASVNVAGPALALTRTYNSQDIRTTGAFGPGWSTPWDQRLTQEPDGGVVATLQSGLQARFGKNADGTLAPPFGQNLTLKSNVDGSWTLRDPSGDQRTFDPSGRIASVIDANQRTQIFGYDANQHLSTVTDAASARALHVSWTGTTAADHIASVSTDPPAPGQSAYTWTYTYTGGLLTKVCTPLGASSCTSYTYATSSHYRSVVLNDNPVVYWPLGEPSGATTATNLAAQIPGAGDAPVSGVSFGQSGAAAGSPDTAAAFMTSANSTMTLPANVLNSAQAQSLEIWFKVTANSGNNGVLFAEQNTPITGGPNNYMSDLYVGTDAKLHGQFYADSPLSAGMVSPARVDDGQWHYAALTTDGLNQTLYLDGNSLASIGAHAVDHLDMVYGYIGIGRGCAACNTAEPDGTWNFTGNLDEPAIYHQQLSGAQIQAHYAARVSSKRLSTVVEPGSFTATSLTYNHATGRVTSMLDRNGATWTLTDPTIVATPDGAAERQVSLTSDAKPNNHIVYGYDPVFGGRLVSRGDEFGSRHWTYGPKGFLQTFKDENGDITTYGTDDRGNVTSTTTCRTAGNPATDCHTSYATYFLSTSDPLDRRNDVQVSTSDARSSGPADQTYQTSKTLNDAGQPTQITYPVPAGQTTHPTESFVYSTGAVAGLLLSTTGRNGGVTTNTYTPAGDLEITTDPVGLVTTNKYDGLGRITSVNRSSNVTGSLVDYGTTTTTYTVLSQPFVDTAPAITNPVTGVTHRAVTTYGYDTMGRRTSQAVSDAAGGDTTRTTSWGYDAAGRMTSTTNPDGSQLTQQWDHAGDMTVSTKPGLSLTMTYDDAHRVLTTTANGVGVDPEHPTATTLMLESRSYDPTGRMTQRVDAIGRVTSFTYYGDNLPNTSTADLTSSPDVDLAHFTYDAAGHQASVTTAGGRTTAFTYDAAGNVATQAVDPAGLNRVTATFYNLDGTVHHTTLSVGGAGRTERVDHTYDAAGRALTSTVDNTGGSPPTVTTTLVRDPRGLVTSSTDPSGVGTAYAYDLAGQLSSTTGTARTVWVNGSSTAGVQPVSTVGRNTFGDATQQRDPNGNVTTTVYDSMSRPTSVTQPAYTPPGGTAITATSSTIYTPSGLVDTSTDAGGQATHYTYDPYGQVLTRTDPDPDGTGPKPAPVWTYTYDRDAELVLTVDPTGAQTASEYDGLGHKTRTKVSDHVGSTLVWYDTNLTVDDAGNTTAVTTPLGHVTTTVYDAANEPTMVTDPSGRFTRSTYDLAGRVVATVHGQTVGQTTTYANPVTTTYYNLAGRATTNSNCLATSSGYCGTVLSTATVGYDGAGRTVQTTTAEGRPTFYTYDTAGQLTTITQRVDPTVASSAVRVSLGCDPDGNKTRMVDGDGNATTYSYNTWNLLESTIEPSTTAHPNAVDRTWTTAYNAVGLPTVDTLPGGVTRTRTYDGLNRLTAETGAGASTTARSLGYDALGRISSATSPAGNLTFAYTERGQLGTAAGYGGTTSYTYDGDNQTTGRTDTAGAATFGYDSGGRLTSIVDPLSGTTATTTYDTAGRPATTSYGTSRPSRTYVYDNFGRIASDTTTKPGGTTSASISYTYDRDNLIIGETTTGLTGAGANTYTYDGLSRVTSWLNPGGTTTTYGYDAASNRTSVTTPAGTRTSTYDQRNRITGTTGAGGTADTFAFNARGQLTTSTRGGVTTSYTYDAFERLTQATESPGTTTYTYDSLDRAAQRNGANFAYNDLTNNPASTPAASGETKLLRDLTGKPLSTKAGSGTANLLLADTRHDDVDAGFDPTTGNLGPSTDYDPWGAPTSTTGTSPPVGYQGGYTDPDTGLINAHARWYDPTLGAFTSRDTVTVKPSPVAQANRYAYAGDSPLNATDNDGHRLTCESDDGGIHFCATGEWGAPSPTEQSGYLKAKTVSTNTSTPVDHPLYENVDDHSVLPSAADQSDCRKDGCAGADRYPTMPSMGGQDSPMSYSTPEAYAAMMIYKKYHCDAYSSTACTDRNGSNMGQEYRNLEKYWAEIWATFDPYGYLQFVQWSYDTDRYGCSHATCAIESAFLAASAFAGAAGAEIADRIALARAERAALADGGMAGDDLAAGGGAKQSGRSIGTDAAYDPEGDPLNNKANDNYAGCANSFSADTPVLMADGTTQPIGDLRPGDHVLSTDPTTAGTSSRQVTATHINRDGDLLDVTVSTGIGRAILHTTQNHPFWDATTAAWTPAVQLHPGDKLHSQGSLDATIIDIQPTAGTNDMHNLTVADVHTYYVVAGDTPVLVHNCGVDPSTPTGSKGNPLRTNTPNTPDVIGGREYTGHALDRMQQQGITPSVVENAISGTPIPGKVPGTTAFYDSANNITVITDTGTGRVVTVDYGMIRQ
jgi:RHS repeat-associated protein